MKRFKIIFITSAISIMIYFSYVNFFTGADLPDPTGPEHSKFDFLENEIELLKNSSENTFSVSLLNTIKFKIDIFYNNPKFSNNATVNNNWRNYFIKKLFIVYANKFLKQAEFIFNNSTWSTNDILTIRTELQRILSTHYFIQGTPIHNSLLKINNTLTKYDEINNFINSCLSYNPSLTLDPLVDPFPINEIKNKLLRVRSLQNNRLENKFVNNCERLHNQLNAIHNNYLLMHFNFLRTKFNEDGNQQYIENETTQRSYNIKYLTPDQNALNEFNYELYQVNDYQSKREVLYRILQENDSRSHNHFNP